MPRKNPTEKAAARELRTQGVSIREIAARLGVSQSSVSLWVRDVELTAEQRAALAAANPTGLRGRTGSPAWSQRNRERRAAAQEHGRQLAQRGDPLHVAGCMLYWGEGSKKRNAVVMSNSDVALVQFFLRFLRRCYLVSDEQVALSINCFLGNGLSLSEIEQWWLRALDLPATCLRTAAVNRASRASQGKRRPLVHGTARLAVHSTFIVQSIYGAIQEYSGVDHPEWIDLSVVVPSGDALADSNSANSTPSGDRTRDLLRERQAS